MHLIATYNLLYLTFSDQNVYIFDLQKNKILNVIGGHCKKVTTTNNNTELL